MNENNLLREIAHIGYIKIIEDKINIDFCQKKYYYLIENPILYPEEYYNMKYNIVDEEYVQNLMEIRQKTLNLLKMKMVYYL